MRKVHLLPENIANKIAAGEVVQRPESVVKELMENAIDADATEIQVVIKKGGKSLIQVIDNGYGMDEDDLITSIKKHATSKISAVEDLDNILTYGFRGEALSSIASVSQFEIKSKTESSELGTLISIGGDSAAVKGGSTIRVEKVSMNTGTVVTVKNLFYNVPARRNFLKTDNTELKHIVDIFKKLSLSQYNLSFKLIIDDSLVYNFAGSSFEDRIKQVFGLAIFNALIPVKEITEYISIVGYIGRPVLFKKNREDQYLFLNKRYVNSKQVNYAIFTAYENLLEKGEYPFFIVFLTIDPRRVDVNVHPSKLEIRFDDEKDIFTFVLSIIRKGIATHDLVPTVAFQDNANIHSSSGFLGSDKLTFSTGNPPNKYDFSDRGNRAPIKSSMGKPVSEHEIEEIFKGLTDIVDNSTMPHNLQDPFSVNNENTKTLTFSDDISGSTNTQSASGTMYAESSSFIVQLHNKYILSPIKSGLMIIDQHVAHERILYEKIKGIFEQSDSFSQQLLFPKTVQFDPGSYNILKDLKDYFYKIGFEIKFLTNFEVEINSVPLEVREGDEENILREILNEYIENFRVRKILDEKENMAKSYSCKAALKAGAPLSQQEMNLLIDELFACKMPYVCPHGRPIVIKISLDEFDKRFGRT